MRVLVCCILLAGATGRATAIEPPREERDARLAAARARLDEGQILELTANDVAGALELYRSVARDETLPADLRSRAWFRTATAERRRGNLQAAVAALERVVSLAPGDLGERRLASRILGRLRSGAGEAGNAVHDWHDALVANEAVRGELLRLTSQLASADRERSDAAARRLRAHGTVALPVIRGALASARGRLRIELLGVAAECGDWRRLGDLLLAAEPAAVPAIERFVETALGWPNERRQRLRQFIETELAAGLRDVPAARTAYLRLAAGEAAGLAANIAAVRDDEELGAHLERALEKVLGRQPVATAHLVSWLESLETISMATAELARPLLARRGGELPSTLLARLYQVDAGGVLEALGTRGEFDAAATLVREQGLQNGALQVVLGRETRQQLQEQPHRVLDLIDARNRQGLSDLLAAVVQDPLRHDTIDALRVLSWLAREDALAREHLGASVRSVWRSTTEPPARRPGRALTPSIAPPPRPLTKLWSELLASAPRQRKGWTLELALPDLAWDPRSSAAIATCLEDPEFLTGNAQRDLDLHERTLAVLVALERARSDRNTAAASERLDAFRSEVLRVLARDLHGALSELTGVADPSLPRALEQLGNARSTGSSLARARLRHYGTHPFLPTDAPLLAELLEEGEVNWTIAALVFRERSSRLDLPGGELQRDLVLELVRRLPDSPQVTELAAELLSRLTGDRNLALAETLSPWESLQPETVRPLIAELVKEGGRTAGLEHDTRRKIASYLRRAIDDGSLPLATRAAAFAALPVASLEALRDLVRFDGEEFREQLVGPSELTGSLGAATSPPVPPIPFRPWFAALPSRQRPEALRLLAASDDIAAIALAVRLGAALEDGVAAGELPETTRIEWTARLVERTAEGVGADGESGNVARITDAADFVAPCLLSLRQRRSAELAKLLQRVIDLGETSAPERKQLLQLGARLAESLLFPEALGDAVVQLRSDRVRDVDAPSLAAHRAFIERWRNRARGLPVEPASDDGNQDDDPGRTGKESESEEEPDAANANKARDAKKADEPAKVEDDSEASEDDSPATNEKPADSEKPDIGNAEPAEPADEPDTSGEKETSEKSEDDSDPAGTRSPGDAEKASEPAEADTTGKVEKTDEPKKPDNAGETEKTSDSANPESGKDAEEAGKDDPTDDAEKSGVGEDSGPSGDAGKAKESVGEEAGSDREGTENDPAPDEDTRGDRNVDTPDDEDAETPDDKSDDTPGDQPRREDVEPARVSEEGGAR